MAKAKLAVDHTRYLPPSFGGSEYASTNGGDSIEIFNLFMDYNGKTHSVMSTIEIPSKTSAI